MEPSEKEPTSQPETSTGTDSPPQPPAVTPESPSPAEPQVITSVNPNPNPPIPPTDTTKPEIVVGTGPAADSGTPKPPRDNKKLLFVLGVVIFIAALGGYIFGMYLPNQPDYAWNNGLSNTGKVIDKVTDKLTEKNNLEKIKKTELIISGEIKGDGYDYSANLNSKFDDDKSTTNAKVNAGDGSVEKLDLKAEILTEIPAGKLYPDIYFKVTGLKNISMMDIGQTYGEFDDKWFHVSSEYLESLYKRMGEKPEKTEQITSGDTADFIKIISKTNQEYIFTSDKNKAVLVNKGFKSKEVVDGVQTFKYEVGVDKQHAKDYCRTLTNRLLDSALVKKIAPGDEESLKDSKKDVEKDCNESVDDYVKDDEKLEAWVNTKHRILHKVRKYSGSDKTVYTEVGQIYKGGDKLSVFFVTHDDAEQFDSKLTLELDSKDLISKGTYTATKKSDEQFEIKATIEVKPHSGEVKVVKPEGAIDIQTIMQELGFDSSSMDSGGYDSGTTSSRAEDTERQVDIKALQGQLEAYYAQHGYYPTLADVNSVSWRRTNMKGLDDEALRDPDGTTKTLATVASSTQYGYKTEDCSGSDGCQKYTLEAQLSNGSKYTKTSLN